MVCTTVQSAVVLYNKNVVNSATATDECVGNSIGLRHDTICKQLTCVKKPTIVATLDYCTTSELKINENE